MTQPNILIVMTDHQRADTVLPEHSAKTPNLDRLVEEGVAFTETYCPTPHCCPARATFFSGLYPTGHGIWNNVCNGQALNKGLNEGVTLFSEDLAEAGYNLFYTGKWHVTAEEEPADRGWQEGTVTCRGSDHHGQDWSHYQNLPPDPAERGEGQILRPGYGPATVYGTLEDGFEHGDATSMREAVEALPKLAEAGKPWALYCGFLGPHDPYWAYQKYLDMYDIEDVPLPASYADEMTDKPHIYQRMREMRFGQLSEREVREAIRHFWARCTYLDDLFGQILAALVVCPI
jgi:arylsulfatase A-like enzyme